MTMSKFVLCTAEVLLKRSLLYWAVETNNKEMFDEIHEGKYEVIQEGECNG
jgi:hypothetical protein